MPLLRLKYIISNYTPVIFNECLNHSDVARCTYGEIESAGFMFITIEDNALKVTAYGESISLSLKSRKQDSEILTKFLNNED